MEYSINLLDEDTLNKLLNEDDLYLNEPDYSGPEYNDIGDLDDEDFDKYVVDQLETEEWVSLVNG
tara:strand:- start:49 stop:243 length:195 start_codon:yes stop_codon:yes gene_type:complete